MTAKDLKLRLLRLLGYDDPGTATVAAQDDVTQAVNQAYQLLWNDVPVSSRTHYTRRIDQVALTAGEKSYLLASDVQNVLPPVRLVQGDRALMPAEHKSEVLSYGLLQGSTLPDTTNTRPEVYFLERIAQSQDDGTRSRLLVAPTPSTAETMEVEVETQAPSFTTADFCSGTPPALQIPHAYAESLLFPVAAGLLAGRSTHFYRNDLMPTIQADYQRALQSVGLSDPLPTAAENAQKPGDS